ncbi:MAG: FAD-dependent oxidoreductase [Rhizobiaceae bacterium]
MDADITCDVLLVGAGVGSMAAAIALKRRGLEPFIVEKTDRVGGATAYSGGIVWAPDNFRMRAKGIADSPEQALTYLDHVSGQRGDPAIARAYVENVNRVVEDLQRATALRWVTYPGLPDYFSEFPGGVAAGRYLLPHGDLVRDALEKARSEHPEMAQIRPAVHLGARQDEWVWGRALAGSLWARILYDAIPYRLNHRATSFVTEGGRVVGAELGNDGRGVVVRSRLGVLLDTGGFEWDEDMSRRYVPGPALHPQTPPSNEGDGHRMAARLGAAFALMDQTIGMPSIRVAGEVNDGRQLYRILFQEMALPHSLLVNAAGKRFANETFFVDVASAWGVADDAGRFVNLPCFLVFDAEYLKRYGLPGGVDGSHMHRADTLPALASATGVDPQNLVASINAFNAEALAGRADSFGRGRTAYQRAFGDKDAIGNPTLGPVTRSPFYSVRIHPATSGHRGGVVIDPAGRVLDNAGRAISGLYACGTVAAGTLTGAAYFTGTAVGHALVFGTLAAEAIATGWAERHMTPQPDAD